MRNAAVRKIVELSEKDKNIVVIAGDLGFGVWDEFREKYPERFFNAGICEQGMASIAAGMAMEGKKVYLYSIGNFTTMRCMEQIRNDICYHSADVAVLAVGGGFAYGSLGMSHHATEDISMMRSLPEMKVFVPADAMEAERIVQDAYLEPGPCYIRLGKGREASIHTGLRRNFHIGKAFQVREGNDACIFAAGAVITEALAASDLLAGDGIMVDIYSFHCIKPIDETVIHKCAVKFDKIITLEEHSRIGGLGSAVSEVVTENGYGTKIIRLGLQDEYADTAGSQAYLRKCCGIDQQAVIKAVKGLEK